jgi:hypothetical protein
MLLVPQAGQEVAVPNKEQTFSPKHSKHSKHSRHSKHSQAVAAVRDDDRPVLRTPLPQPPHYHPRPRSPFMSALPRD